MVPQEIVDEHPLTPDTQVCADGRHQRLSEAWVVQVALAKALQPLARRRGAKVEVRRRGLPRRENHPVGFAVAAPPTPAMLPWAQPHVLSLFAGDVCHKLGRGEAPERRNREVGTYLGDGIVSVATATLLLLHKAEATGVLGDLLKPKRVGAGTHVGSAMGCHGRAAAFVSMRLAKGQRIVDLSSNRLKVLNDVAESLVACGVASAPLRGAHALLHLRDSPQVVRARLPAAEVEDEEEVTAHVVEPLEVVTPPCQVGLLARVSDGQHCEAIARIGTGVRGHASDAMCNAHQSEAAHFRRGFLSTRAALERGLCCSTICYLACALTRKFQAFRISCRSTALRQFLNMADWRRCSIDNVVVATLATNAAYLAQASRLVASAAAVVPNFRCAAMVVSDELQSAKVPSQLVPVFLPGRANWRPPPEWCVRKLSGWRHTSVLKLGALRLFLDHADVLFVDADWRFIQDPLPTLRRCAESKLEVMGGRDDHFVNLGLLYVRATPTTRLLAARAANRSFVAWDQALINEEMRGQADLSCCVANDFLASSFQRSDKVHAMKHRQQPRCAASDSLPSGPALGPPPLDSRTTAGEEAPPKMWRGGWSPLRFNELTSAYHHRCPGCYNQCSRTRCSITPGSCRRAPSEAAPARALPSTPRARDPACTYENGCCQRHPKACSVSSRKRDGVIGRRGRKALSNRGAAAAAAGSKTGRRRGSDSSSSNRRLGSCIPLPISSGMPVCIDSSGGNGAMRLGCELPYNRPGVADYQQLGANRPVAPAITISTSSACARPRSEHVGASARQRHLLIWRGSYPFNYMEAVRRLLGEASTLLSLAPETTDIAIPLASGLTLPSYYEKLLLPFARVVGSGTAVAPAGSLGWNAHAVGSATLCCVRKPTKINVSAARAVLGRIVRAHCGSDSFDLHSLRAAEEVDVLLVERRAPRWAGISNGRRIVHSAELLQACRQSGRQCTAIDFGAVPFADAVRAVSAARVLVGVHGAGLTNAVVRDWRSKTVPVHPSSLSAANVPCSLLHPSSLCASRMHAKTPAARCCSRSYRMPSRSTRSG